METTKISIDQSKIDQVIRTYSPAATIKGPDVNSAQLHVYHTETPGRVEATLNIYLLNDGKTTLTYKTGKNHSLGEKVANHITTECKIKNTTIRSLKL